MDCLQQLLYLCASISVVIMDFIPVYALTRCRSELLTCAPVAKVYGSGDEASPLLRSSVLWVSALHPQNPGQSFLSTAVCLNQVTPVEKEGQLN